MRECATELFESDVFTRDRLDDVRAGNEHVAGLVDHDDEVGQCGGVNGSTCCRAHDDRDLGDNTRGCSVTTEDFAVLTEGDNALLNSSSTRVEHADDGNTGANREVHDLDDLFTGNLTERTTEDGEVLRIDGNLTTVNGSGSGDDRVTVGALCVHAERCGAVTNELVQLDERARVEQLFDALAGCLLALGVLLLDGGFTAGGYGLVETLLEVGKFARGSERVNRFCFVSHAFNTIEERTRDNVSMTLSRTREISPRVLWLPEIGSTNTELARLLALEPADAWPHLSVVATDNQTAGKGRLGRTWTAPAGASLAVSVLVRPGRGRAFDAQGYGWLPLIAGAAMATALSQLVPSPAAVELKWPNDVQIDGLKVCGILTELQPDGSVIIGSGVNLTLSADQLPTPTSTSLALAGAEVSADDVIARYLAVLAPLLDELAGAGGIALGTSIPDFVSQRCNTIGQSVRIELPSGEKPIGTATGLDSRGCLQVTTSDGQPLVVAAGDVTHLRVIMNGE